MARICTEIDEWIEEEVTRPVEQWVERQEERCRDYPWYDPRGWVCWLVTVLVKVTVWVTEIVGRWVTRTICTVVSAIVNLVTAVLVGLWDVVVGIVTLDGQRILDGLLGIGIGILENLLEIGRVVLLLDTVQFITEEINRGRLKAHVRGLLEQKYDGRTLERIKDAIRLDNGAFGLRLTGRAIRTKLDSETMLDGARVPNLVALHEAGAINLRELCGFETPQGYWNRKRYKTLKKETVVTGGGGGEFDNPISESELDTYISSRGSEGPAFIVLAMRDGVLETKLKAANDKAKQLGLMLSWEKQNIEVTQADHIVNPGFDRPDAVGNLQNLLQGPIGRTRQSVDMATAIEELCVPTIVGVFRYTDGLRGLAACLMGSTCQTIHDASGASFIDNQPDSIWKYVPIHELGHTFGLCHTDGIDRVMYSARGNGWFSFRMLWKMLLLDGEPSFTLDEAKQAWDYIVEHFSAECLMADA